jgi:hypothetical protein
MRANVGVQENPNFAKFRKNGLCFFTELDSLFQGKGTAGAGAQKLSQLATSLGQENAAVPSSITEPTAGIQVHNNTQHPAKPTPTPFCVKPAATVGSFDAAPLPRPKAVPPPTTATTEAGKADNPPQGGATKGAQKRKSTSLNGTSQTPTTIEDSVTIVRKEFMGTFNEEQLSIIWCFLEDRCKTCVFVSLPKGHRKDWLLKQIKIYQRKEEDHELEREVRRLKIQKLSRECREQGI